MHRIPVTLTIAGSDSGGGAGIQADIKAMSALGCFATSAITAITAQNTRGVSAVQVLAPELVRAQIDAVAGDFDLKAVKTGMLGDVATVEVVADAVQRHDLLPLVVDPVMIAKGGDALLADAAVAAVQERLLPYATLVTPNAPEAARLVGFPVEDLDSARAAAEALVAMGPRAALVKGGHLPARRDEDGDPLLVDVLFDGERMVEIVAPRHDTPHTHGTGCTYAAAIAAMLARGHGLVGAVRLARRYLGGAVAHGLAIGGGIGPTDHFFFLEPGAEPWIRATASADD
ncbi:MAG: bifunctional hydroxymethylpyrimidine kinase/phosphomethylpyrimidine kinase [Ilumatobacteraceae bacterium]|jgi:hydroxymethylpyrimidine/phosphomethylpyrimidine kinase